MERAMKKYLAVATAVIALGLATESNAALKTCFVADPTGTPLNVRSRPNGNILGALHNDTPVILTELTAANGRIWVKVVPNEGKVGWVFFDYLDCQDLGAH
jgi:hypothetical protein